MLIESHLASQLENQKRCGYEIAAGAEKRISDGEQDL